MALDAFALALFVIELAAMENHRNVLQYHSFEQMVANRHRVLDTVVGAALVVDDLCTTMKLICVDPPNTSKLARDAEANSLALDSFQPLVSVHFDADVVTMDYFASDRRAAVDFVDCVEIDAVPMTMVAIGSACATIRDVACVMDYQI